MSGFDTLLRRAGEWLVEAPEGGDRRAEPLLPEAPPRTFPLLAVVGLARRSGATTLARALGVALAMREGGAAVVASPERPAVVALGNSGPAGRLAETLSGLGHVRAAGRLCLTSATDAGQLRAATRTVAPAVIEVEPGAAAVDAARLVDRVVLVASPSLEPALAAAVAETIEALARAPLVVVNRAADQGTWLGEADVLVPESRMGARLALAGREPRGLLGRAVDHVVELCGAG